MDAALVAVGVTLLIAIVTGVWVLGTRIGKVETKVAVLTECVDNVKGDVGDLRSDLRDVAVAARREVNAQVAERTRIQRRDRLGGH